VAPAPDHAPLESTTAATPAPSAIDPAAIEPVVRPVNGAAAGPTPTAAAPPPVNGNGHAVNGHTGDGHPHGGANGHQPASGNGHSQGGGNERPNGCTAPQLRRFIKSRPYVPIHELRRRFAIDGTDDDVTQVDVDGSRVYVGLPAREGSLLGELLRGGEIGYELSFDPLAPIVVGVYPMRPVPRS
jgi:hypothetical protein